MGNGRFVNDVCFRRGGPVDFKDLRTTIALGRVWVRRRLAVGIPTAISVAKENAGRKTGFQVSVLRVRRMPQAKRADSLHLLETAVMCTRGVI